jgi:hypothetical protein
MSGYNLLYESGSKEMPSGGGAPAIAVGEPNPGAPIPVEPNGGPGGDAGPLYGGNPWSHLLDDLSSWFPMGNDLAAKSLRFVGHPLVRETVPTSSPVTAKPPLAPTIPWTAGKPLSERRGSKSCDAQPLGFRAIPRR